jgi:predicted permease
MVGVGVLLVASARSIASGANFDPSQVALLRVRPRLVEYPPPRAQAFQREVLRRLEAIPGVAAVTLVGTGAAPFLGSGEVSIPEWRAPGRGATPAGYGEVGPRYFETLRTPVVRGREVDDRDRIGAPPVAVVNETLARRLWPGGDVVGSRLLVNGRPHSVVGIVADVRLQSRGEPQKPFVYVSYWQNPAQVDARYYVRVRGDAGAMLPALVREVNRLDPAVPVTDTVTMSFFLAHTMLHPVRLNATFLGYAAGLAVLLSALGLYGTMAFSVSRRAKEVGIRMALGAARRDVFGLILGEGMAAVLGGVAAGLGLALAGARLVRHLLYASAVPDGAAYAVAGLLVAAASLCACSIPARRATRVEPAVALRME